MGFSPHHCLKAVNGHSTQVRQRRLFPLVVLLALSGQSCTQMTTERVHYWERSPLMPRSLLAFLVFVFFPPLFAAKPKINAAQTNTEDMWVTSTVPELPTDVTHHTFNGASMSCQVGFCIYMPPSYQKDTEQRYPMIYDLHGAGGNEALRVYSASVLYEGIVAGKLPKIVMVFPNGGRSTTYEDSSKGRYMAETMMTQELIPRLDAKYRTIADRKARCSEGIAHPTKRMITLAVNKSADVDDVKDSKLK